MQKFSATISNRAPSSLFAVRYENTSSVMGCMQAWLITNSMKNSSKEFSRLILLCRIEGNPPHEFSSDRKLLSRAIISQTQSITEGTFMKVNPWSETNRVVSHVEASFSEDISIDLCKFEDNLPTI